MFARSCALSDGVEQSVRHDPPSEWTHPPISVALDRAGGFDGVIERVEAFIDNTLH